ncbi:MAG: zinc-ribbon domain-containing protein [Anaerolineaceae bacterium]|nr:zinc-ribbon domain-containing protein [Anaerolineaceae bacterium]
MHFGTILVVLGLSLFLAAYIAHPFQADDEELEAVIESRVAEMRQAAHVEENKAQFCTQCGHKLGADDRFCAQCGQPVENDK